MPPKRRSNNKKKNKNKGKFGNGRDKRTTNSSQSAAPVKPGKSIKGKPPASWDNLIAQTNSNLHQAYPTVYSRYKKATNRFLDYMKRLSPSEMRQGTNGSISSLMATADMLANTGHVMDRSILRDLKLAIRIRTRVQQSVYGGGDAGHQYFLKVLTYCWSVLNSLPKTAENEKASVDTDAPNSKQHDTNPFNPLMEDSDEEEELAVDEVMFPSTPVGRPSLPSGSQPLSLDELMNSDERNDAILFLLSLDEIMECVAYQYQIFFKSFSGEDSTFVEHLLEAAVATNMAIQQVQQLEMDLLVQYEHLTTPYRLLATIVFPEVTHHVTATVREHAAKEGCTESDVSVFLGDCMETYFRTSSDPCNRREEVVKEFCNTWQVNSVGTTELLKYYKGLHQYVELEVPIAREKHNPERSRIRKLAQEHAGGAFPSPHSWIKNMRNIGGDRAIHHTLRLLQIFGQAIHGNKTETSRGVFGTSPWRAKRVPGTKIRDLDELLMTDILPEWVMMCREGILGDRKLPSENELCPLFVLMRKYIQEPDRPVTWSITFAVHAILTAILEVEPHLTQLMEMSKLVFDNYFEQARWAITLTENNPESLGNPTSPEQHSWWDNMYAVLFLENLGLEAFGLRTLWNPLCAGTIFSYLSYFGNLEAGCIMIDCQAQLRITLHLFHALLVTGILRRGEILFLDSLYDNFRKSKAIWGGHSLPQKGELVQRFWVCFGLNVAESKKLSNDAKQSIREIQEPSTFNRDNHRNNNRKLIGIETSEISKSYRRICNRDFHDVVDKIHTPEERQRLKHREFYRLTVNINDTMDAIEEEQILLSTHLPACSIFLEQFINSLGRVLQWEPLLQAMARCSGVDDQRQFFVTLFARNLLGALDFADDPFAYNFMNVSMVQVSSFMSTFFNKLDPRRARWFQAEDGASQKLVKNFLGRF